MGATATRQGAGNGATDGGTSLATVLGLGVARPGAKAPGVASRRRLVGRCVGRRLGVNEDAIDTREHAYYPDCQERKGEYVAGVLDRLVDVRGEEPAPRDGPRARPGPAIRLLFRQS